MEYKKISNLIACIEGKNRDSCQAMFRDHKNRFEASPGSLSKHQAWKGGYIHHLEEAMNLGIELYELMNKKRKLDFSISDVILVLFLHDLEKPFRYVEPKREFLTDEEKEAFIDEMVASYGIILTPNHVNALKYVHGEGNAYSRTERTQSPLAAFVHMCDVASARIWFDYPKV